MNDRLPEPSAWVIAVRMGYGHQRTAHPLRHLAPGGDVLLADDYPGIPDGDRAVWRRMRRFYEFMSNVHDVPAVGRTLFKAFDAVQRILSFYPRRDLSRADLNVRALYGFLRRGWGRDLIERLKADGRSLPIVTSFYTPAFMAEFFGYPGDIYCVVCDADIARAWAPVRPSSSRIRYFVPTRRAAERLHLYGLNAEHVHLTGYPLPDENVGSGFAILKEDLAQRIVNLDPERQYLERYGALIPEKVGALPPGPTRPLTILFSIGGAGAQAEIARELLRSFRERIVAHDVRLVISAGIKPWVRDYIERAIEECGLGAEASRVTAESGTRPSDGHVVVLTGERVTDYFDLFNRALRTTDVLWTKPSELSFYSALGLPMILSPPIGAQERANQEWLLRLGAGTLQDDPANADEWVFDLLESGWFAEAAMEGFVEGEAGASQKIAAIVTHATAAPPAEAARPRLQSVSEPGSPIPCEHTMRLAITREISPAITRCELTHLARQPIDLDLARAQHAAYEDCLRALGCAIHRLPAADDLPDSVFVEDCAIVLDEIAVIARPGAVSRRAETGAIEQTLASFRPLGRVQPPATLDGGDVLKTGRTLFVGVSSRTNGAAIEQLRRLVGPSGYIVVAVEVRGCLHLKSAVTEVAPDTLLLNRAWLPEDAFGAFRCIDVDPREPYGANALRIVDNLVYASTFPRTRERLDSVGLSIHAVDVSELAKAEGAVTCCSLIVENL